MSTPHPGGSATSHRVKRRSDRGVVLIFVAVALLMLAALMAPDGRLLAAPDVRAFLMIGILGGFTTFSSFSLETLNLMRDGEWLFAFANVLLSVVLCLVAVWLGHAAALMLSRA